MKTSTLPLPEIIRRGRGRTANLYERKGPTQFGGTNEFWDCVRTLPAARAHECIPYLFTKAGEKEIEIDITQTQKWPIKFELKPNWLWFALGFAAAWILKW